MALTFSGKHIMMSRSTDKNTTNHAEQQQVVLNASLKDKKCFNGTVSALHWPYICILFSMCTDSQLVPYTSLDRYNYKHENVFASIKNINININIDVNSNKCHRSK